MLLDVTFIQRIQILSVIVKYVALSQGQVVSIHQNYYFLLINSFFVVKTERESITNCLPKCSKYNEIGSQTITDYHLLNITFDDTKYIMQDREIL